MFKCIAKPQANYTELLARKQDEPGQKGGGHSSQNGYYQVHVREKKKLNNDFFIFQWKI